MSSLMPVVHPPDFAERERALDPAVSVLVEAPAGSGKTDLLTRRFLRLLAEVDEPGQIVAITFTRAAAAEMRHRILAELEKAAVREGIQKKYENLSMEALASKALARSRQFGWDLVELPSQLRISTIDAFCRELALQQPLLSGLGGGLEIFDNPKELFRRAARRVLEEIDRNATELRAAIKTLLLWRDNGWREMEDLLVEMLAKRDRWMQEFFFREPDWDVLRERLERPFARAVRKHLETLSELLDKVPDAREEALELARFACANTDGARHRDLAELAEFPNGPFADSESLEDAKQACVCLTDLLLTKDGAFRQRIDKNLGFPADRKREKERLAKLIADLRKIPGFEAALGAICALPPVRYAEDDWQIVRACFVLLKNAAAHLQVEFAEAGAVDYTEVGQVALRVLHGEEEDPGEGAFAIADGIHHLLVDEFQDTSRRQHQLIADLISLWEGREGRTCFVVGDPMQSIYFFRDADAELFPQVRDYGLSIPEGGRFSFESALLRTNFRTLPGLIERLNSTFAAVFAEDDGSGVRFTPAESTQSALVRPVVVEQTQRFYSHFEFMPCTVKGRSNLPADDKARIQEERQSAREAQITAIVELIGTHADRIEAARKQGKKYRIAILGRAHTALTPIAEGLRRAGIPFRAVELEKLRDRPEVMDALTIARAMLNPHDRLAWLGLLRAPWCGLSLVDLHMLVSADDAELLKRPVRELMEQRAGLLAEQGRAVVNRVLRAVDSGEAWRAASPGIALGTWIERIWLGLGGADCVDEGARANVEFLWKCLDGLPEGDADVPGSALDAALDKLTALPDPQSDGECGVQLMTIHKAKGLEFEVVIVPELQAGGGRSSQGLLSWLERGLPVLEREGEVTEFLVAPIPSKGADRGKTKAWVDGEIARREKQEARRILYVAGTRAREELHLFARPEYKRDASGALALVTPKGSLLETAWPALRGEAERQFEIWAAGNEADAGELTAIAAEGEHLLETVAPSKPAMLRRLPAHYTNREQGGEGVNGFAISGDGTELHYRRHEGGLLSRALGIAVHTVFEEMARLRAKEDWDATRAAVQKMGPRLIAQVRSVGIDPAQAKRIAAISVEIADEASREASAQWILSPHADAGSEVSWASVAGKGVRAVRVDRVFRAGPEPEKDGDEAWWIVDYKTAHVEGLDPEKALPELRALFAPQLEAYARVLRGLYGADAVIRAGLYYPRVKRFDWWAI